MSLLEVITKASSDPGRVDCESGYPIVLNPDPIFETLQPENEDPIDKVLLKRVNGFEISPNDSQRIEQGQKFFENLKRSLKNKKGFSRDQFYGMLNSFLVASGEKFGEGEERTGELIQKAGLLMGRDVRGLVLEACVVLEDWDSVEGLIRNGLVEHSCVSNLVSNLIAKCRSDLVVSCVKHISDIQSFDLLCVLKYFLCPPKEGVITMVSVRKEWESQALLAISRVSDQSAHGKKANVARDAALLLMLAHDEFSVSELCLHYLFASRNVDEVILGSCIGKLNGTEMVSLIRYLSKWLRKYERFPHVKPCPKASSLLGLGVCDWIPSLEVVVKCMNLVVDEHFSSLVLYPEFHEELRSLGVVADSLASEARLCGSLVSLVGILRSNRRGLKSLSELMADPEAPTIDNERIKKEAPLLVGVLKEMKQGLDNLRNKIDALTSKVRDDHFPTTDGISYLEAKHLLLLNYCQSLVYYLLRKAKGLSIEGHPVVRSLVEIRLFLEKIRPIDKRLQFQLAKYTGISENRVEKQPSTENDKDEAKNEEELLQYRPNPDKLLPKTNVNPEDGGGVYRPPKIAPAVMDEDKMTREERNARRKEAHTLRSSRQSGFMKELMDDVEGRPEEFKDGGSAYASREVTRFVEKLEERNEQEEALFTRAPITKAEKRKLKKMEKPRNGLSDLTESFEDEIRSLPFDHNKPERSSVFTGGSSGARKFKKHKKRH